MSQQRSTLPTAESQAPWSPLVVGLISFLFAGGGAVLTIKNLERLGAIDRSTSRELTYAAIGVFAIGLTVLLILAERGAHGTQQTDYTAIGLVSAGVSVVSYVVQHSPFRAWRTLDLSRRPSSWWTALVTAFLYQIAVTLAATPLWFIALSSGTVPAVVLPR